jgi:uncharacterized protein
MMNNPESNKSGKEMTRMDPDHVFKFNCAPGVPCFTNCCQDVTIVLTPYDVLRLKNALGVSSSEFIDRYTLVLSKEKQLIPMVVLKMNEDDKRCPLVTEKGCTVYNDRPWPCRMFPLNMNDDGTFSFITDEERCKGFREDEVQRISEWLISQGVPVYDEVNLLFSQVTSPLKAQDMDIDNPKIFKMVFMALYNLDRFREFVFQSSFLERFALDEKRIEKIKRSDLELLKVAFDWLKFGIIGQKTFQIKPDAMPKDETED